jgi:molybdate transport system substrate-binding protein
VTSMLARRSHLALLLVAAGLGACRSSGPAAPPEPVLVGAAASLRPAFEELGQEFERQTGQPVAFSFGSSGLIARQIAQGAPFDVFAAADEELVDEAIGAGACDPATRAPYARGRIAVWTRRGGAAPPAALGDLADPRFVRIAIANPEHAPTGRAAKQALEHAGIWGAIEPRLVFGENVRQTLQFGETGNAEAAIVALALVIHDRENPWELVDEAMHRPIDQALVVCSRGRNRAGGDAFARFVDGASGREVMRRHGFLLPGEERTTDP